MASQSQMGTTCGAMRNASENRHLLGFSAWEQLMSVPFQRPAATKQAQSWFTNHI